MVGFPGPKTPDRKQKGWHAFTATQRGSEDTSSEAFPALSPMQGPAPDLNPQVSRKGLRKPQGFDGRRVRSNSPPAVSGRVQGRGALFQEKTPPARKSSQGGEFAPAGNAAGELGGASWRLRIGGRDMRAEAIRQVKAFAPAADDSLISDLLEALNGDVTAVLIQLEEMGFAEPPQRSGSVANVQVGLSNLTLVRDTGSTGLTPVDEDSQPARTRGGSLRRSSRSEGELAELERGAFQDGPGNLGWGENALERGEGEQDPYFKYRGEAIRVSRGRARHAKSAASAFTLGDHARARELSRLAREEGEVAQKLHSQAAEKILAERNADRLGGVWEIDLHGLHANEAVLALSARLQELEMALSALLTSPLENLPSPSGVNAPTAVANAPSEGYAIRKASANVRHLSELPSSRQELMVITGLGNHSKGGPTLPSIISSFLTESGYSFRQARAGVLAVRPTYRYIGRPS